MIEDSSHLTLLVIVLMVVGLVGGFLRYAISGVAIDIKSIQGDHVRRVEFEALRGKVDVIAERQAVVLDRLSRHIADEKGEGGLE